MPLNIDWQQILLHLLNVTLLFAVLYFLLYSPVKKFMQKRVEYYSDLEKQANDKLADAEAMQKSLQEKQDSFDRDSAGKRQQIEAEAYKTAEKTLSDAKKEAEKLLELTRIKAEKEKEEIINEASGQISELAIEAAKKVVMDSTSNAYDKFLESAEGSNPQ